MLRGLRPLATTGSLTAHSIILPFDASTPSKVPSGDHTQKTPGKAGGCHVAPPLCAQSRIGQLAPGSPGVRPEELARIFRRVSEQTAAARRFPYFNLPAYIEKCLNQYVVTPASVGNGPTVATSKYGDG